MSPLGALYAEAINFVHDRDGSFTPHDAVAAISLVAPDLFAWHAYPVRCETSGIFTTGETVVDRRHRTEDSCTLVAEDIDVLKVNSRIISAVGDLDP